MPLFIHSHLDCGDLFDHHLDMYSFHKTPTFCCYRWPYILHTAACTVLKRLERAKMNKVFINTQILLQKLLQRACGSCKHGPNSNGKSYSFLDFQRLFTMDWNVEILKLWNFCHLLHVLWQRNRERYTVGTQQGWAGYLVNSAENWEKLNQRCCSEGNDKARNALPLCPVSAQWEMLGPNEWLEATAPQMPKLHTAGRG